MENKNEDIAAPIKVKKPVSDAQKQANKRYYEKCKAEKGKTNASEAQMKSLKKYYDRVKGTEEYVQKIRNNSIKWDASLLSFNFCFKIIDGFKIKPIELKVLH